VSSAAGTQPRAGGEDGGRAGGRRGTIVLLVGLVLVAGNLRFALTSLGPLIEDLRADLGLSGTTTGLLTTSPLLALGLVSPLAPRLAARFGAERVVLACLVTIFAGVTLRWLHPLVLLFAGTIVAGCAIAVGNVLVPGIVKQRFADRAALMTGVYSVGLSGGAAIAAGLAVPIEGWVGGSWRLALALWALPALLGMLVWWPQLRRAAALRAGEAVREAGAGNGGERRVPAPRQWAAPPRRRCRRQASCAPPASASGATGARGR
jgi:CP family cyanate transporter-like MFS transporter